MPAKPDEHPARAIPVVGITPLGDTAPAEARQSTAGGLTHVVMFRLGPRDQHTRRELRRRLLGLIGNVPSLLSMEVGIDMLGTDRSFDLVLIARFADVDGLEAYQAHPAHQDVLAYLAGIRESAVAVDFITEPGESL